MAEAGKVANWRVVLAAILDALTAFIVLGFAIGWLTGSATAEGRNVGFNLDGWPAILLLVLIVLYFVIGNRMGGTLWKRILGVSVRR